MVIDDLDVRRPFRRPLEAHTPLIVDPDAVLACPVACEPFQPVSGGRGQIPKLGGRIQLIQLAARDGFDIAEAGDAMAPMQALRIGAFERLDRHRVYSISVHDIAQRRPS